MSRKVKKKIWQIALINHDTFKKVLYSCASEEQVYTRFNNLKEENKKVQFPVRYNNEQSIIVESKYEIVILKCKQRGDKPVNRVMDTDGGFALYATNEDNWIVVDKATYEIEETFFVYGYHPRLQRKDFSWIYTNFVKEPSKDKYSFRNIAVYNNKVLFDNGSNLEMVICKNKSDAVRLNNAIEERAHEDRLKNNIFLGDLRGSKYKKEWMDKIQELTGWNRQKILRTSTRP